MVVSGGCFEEAVAAALSTDNHHRRTSSHTPHRHRCHHSTPSLPVIIQGPTRHVFLSGAPSDQRSTTESPPYVVLGTNRVEKDNLRIVLFSLKTGSERLAFRGGSDMTKPRACSYAEHAHRLHPAAPSVDYMCVRCKRSRYLCGRWFWLV